VDSTKTKKQSRLTTMGERSRGGGPPPGLGETGGGPNRWAIGGTGEPRGGRYKTTPQTKDTRTAFGGRPRKIRPQKKGRGGGKKKTERE